MLKCSIKVKYSITLDLLKCSIIVRSFNWKASRQCCEQLPLLRCVSCFKRFNVCFCSEIALMVKMLFQEKHTFLFLSPLFISSFFSLFPLLYLLFFTFLSFHLLFFTVLSFFYFSFLFYIFLSPLFFYFCLLFFPFLFFSTLLFLFFSLLPPSLVSRCSTFSFFLKH